MKKRGAKSIMSKPRELIVDLHVHSRYSRATSKHCNTEGLYQWGKIKGINVIGTGDFTHPTWMRELKEKLEIEEVSGFYRLKPEFAERIDAELPCSVREADIWFVPTVEISTIYKRGDKVRKVHQLVIVPTLERAQELSEQLEKIGNIHSDGRPILGMDSKDLLQKVIDLDDRAMYIPAHIWTPWFALFGSKSGFDTLEEAYGELTPYIRAIETGLSSDPAMNWRLQQLQGITMISNSDAHSPQKLGREATVVRAAPTYGEVFGAIRTNDDRLVGTIEFFPQEGKYHYDGHRLCGVRFTPEETKRHSGLCPKCGKPLTVGVDYRVSELADRPGGLTPEAPKKVEYIIPLPEVLSELLGKGVNTKTVQEVYWRVVEALGDEFHILRNVETAKIRKAGFNVLAEGIERMRSEEVHIEPGYDGVFGVIKVFDGGIGSSRQERLL